VTSTASSEWQPNTMTWWPNKRRLPATVLSEYGKLPADTDVLCTFALFCVIRQVEIYRTRPVQHSDTTSDVLVTPVSTTNKTSLARTWQPQERSHEQRTTVLKCWKCEEAQRESNYRDCSCIKRKRGDVRGSNPALGTRWTQHWLRTGHTYALSTTATVAASPNLDVTSTNYQISNI
jgi:hypothetical protein